MKIFTKISSLLFIITLLGFFSFVSVDKVDAAPSADRTASVSGDWNDTATWGGLSVPTIADDVAIGAGVTINVTENSEAASIVMYAPDSLLTITDSDATLTVADQFNISSPAPAFPVTLDIADGNLVIGAGLGITYGSVNINSGTLTVSTTISLGTDSFLTSTEDSIITLGGDLYNSANGTLTTSGTGTINFNGAGAQTIDDSSTYNNVILSGSGIKSFYGNSTINGNLTIEPGVVAGLVLLSPTTTTLYFDDAYQPAGTYGATGSGADFENDTYFSGATGLLTVLELGESDTTPPDTFITLSDTDSSIATFEFSANEESTFECSLDAAPFTTCTSPYVTPALTVGPHSLEVKAIDVSTNENEDLTPASHEWVFIEPIAAWHLDEEEGTTAEDSFGSNDGTVSGTANWTTGRIGNALSFDGDSNYITIDRPVEDDFTICAWIKTETPGDLDPDHWRLAPIMESEVENVGNDFGFGVDVNGNLAYGNGGGYDETINGVTSIIDNEWHHTCVTRDTSTGDAILYVDGVEDAAGTTDIATLDGNANAYIGFGTDGAVPFGGLIDELLVYSTALSADSILELYQDAPPIITSVSPIDGGEDIGTDALIVITFSDAMEPALIISTGPCEEECAAYDVVWSEDDTVLTLIKTNGPFEEGTEYTIEISEGIDEHGNVMEETYSWSFTTYSPSSSDDTSTRKEREKVRQSWDEYYGTETVIENSTPVDVSLLFNRLTRRGDRGAHVVQLQTILNTLGYTLTPDGIFGPMTETAVKDFQTKHGLISDGIVGPMTLGEFIK